MTRIPPLLAVVVCMIFIPVMSVALDNLAEERLYFRLTDFARTPEGSEMAGSGYQQLHHLALASLLNREINLRRLRDSDLIWRPSQPNIQIRLWRS